MNIHIIGVTVWEEREKGIKKSIWGNMPENFPDLKKETDIQVQEAQKVPNKMNPKRSTPRNFIIKMTKGKIKRKF